MNDIGIDAVRELFKIGEGDKCDLRIRLDDGKNITTQFRGKMSINTMMLVIGKAVCQIVRKPMESGQYGKEDAVKLAKLVSDFAVFCINKGEEEDRKWTN